MTLCAYLSFNFSVFNVIWLNPTACQWNSISSLTFAAHEHWNYVLWLYTCIFNIFTPSYFFHVLLIWSSTCFRSRCVIFAMQVTLIWQSNSNKTLKLSVFIGNFYFYMSIPAVKTKCTHQDLDGLFCLRWFCYENTRVYTNY